MGEVIVCRPVDGITLNMASVADTAVRCSRACWMAASTCASPVTNLSKTHEGDDAIRVLVVEPEHRPEVREIDSSLKSMQNIVDGLIQPIYPFDDPVALICNEEGKLMGLPANRGLRDGDGQICDIVFGTFFLCGAPSDCDHFTGLPPEQIEQYERRFHTPEMFWGMDGRIVCLPLEAD